MKKRIVSMFVLSLMVVLMLASCGSTGSDTQYDVTKVDDAKAQEMYESGDYLFIDVRTLDEYNEKHIPGAKLVTIDTSNTETFKSSIVAAAPDKEAKIVVYCKAGYRSDIAAKAMSTLGYKNVYDMTVGMDGWTGTVETIDY